MIDEGRHSKENFSGESGSARMVKFHPEYLDDTTLWKAFKDGDDSALVTIFDLHARSLFSYGCKIFDDKETVKDTIQDLFATLLQNRSGLGDTNAIRFYLFKSLRRRLVRLKIKSRVFGFFEFDQSSPSHEFVLISQQVSIEQATKLSTHISQLTRKQQEAIYFRFHENLSYDQIAVVMGIQKQTAYNLINCAIKILKDAIKF